METYKRTVDPESMESRVKSENGYDEIGKKKLKRRDRDFMAVCGLYAYQDALGQMFLSGWMNRWFGYYVHVNNYKEVDPVTGKGTPDYILYASRKITPVGWQGYGAFNYGKKKNYIEKKKNKPTGIRSYISNKAGIMTAREKAVEKKAELMARLRLDAEGDR